MDADRGVPVHREVEAIAEPVDRAREEPLQVHALEPPRGEVLRAQVLQLPAQVLVQGRDVGQPALQDGIAPLGQGRSVVVRASALDGGVREHGDVLRHGVQLEQRTLLAPPDPPGAGAEGLDQVDVHRPGGQEGSVGGQALEQQGGPRPTTDQDQVPAGGAVGGACRVCHAVSSVVGAAGPA